MNSDSLFVLPLAMVDDGETIKEGGVCFTRGGEPATLAVCRVRCRGGCEGWGCEGRARQ